MREIRAVVKWLLPLLLSFTLFGYLSIGVHEQFHYMVAQALGIRGYVTFSSMGGQFHYASTPTPLQDSLVGLAGGLGTSLLFFALWYLSHFHTRSTHWELTNSLGLFSVAVGQAVYATFDAWARGQVQEGAVLGLALGALLGMVVHWGKVWEWLADGRQLAPQVFLAEMPPGSEAVPQEIDRTYPAPDTPPARLPSPLQI